MPSCRPWLTLGIVAAVGCAEEPSASVNFNPTGDWLMSFTVAGRGLTCSFDSVLLTLGDPTAVPHSFMNGAANGSCVSPGRYDTTLTFAGSRVDSLIIGAGTVRFVVFAGGWHFVGRIISTDSLAGTLSQDTLDVGIGAIHLTGPWSARRQLPSP
jgi:hypothetical protein